MTRLPGRDFSRRTGFVPKGSPGDEPEVVRSEITSETARVRLAVISEQGYYLYQGGRTARKWQALLNAIADAAYADKR